jgi:hypothetical protein
MLTAGRKRVTVDGHDAQQPRCWARLARAHLIEQLEFSLANASN